MKLPDNYVFPGQMTIFDFLYGGGESEMNKEEIPFSDPPLPEKGCWNCLNYNGDFCTKEWNNMDECYKVAWRDEKKPEDCCDDWRLDETISMEDVL